MRLQLVRKSLRLKRENATRQNNSPSSTSFTMLRRTPLTPISGNKASRKELDLLTKGKIADQSELEAGPTQIGRNLNIPRITVQSVLRRLETTFSGVNKVRSGRPTVITPRDSRALLRYVRLNPKTTWNTLKHDTRLNVDRDTLDRTLKAHGISH